MSDSNEVWPVLNQQEVLSAPTYFADVLLGSGAGFGVGRLTLGAFKLNTTSGADLPAVSPVVTIIMPEPQLIQLALDILDRAEKLGVKPSGEPVS